MATIEPYQATECEKQCGKWAPLAKGEKRAACRKTGHASYRVRYRKPDGKQTDKRFRRKSDAEQFANTVEVSKLAGEYVAPSLGRITVCELAPNWLLRKEVDVAPSNYRTLETAWRVHVQPRWGTTPVADIELDAVEVWIADMGRTVTDPKDPEKVIRKGSGATTIIRAYGVLAGILDTAVKAKRLRSNPARGVENLPKKVGKRHVYLTRDDVARLANESGADRRALVLTLAYCGIRWGEAVALRVSDIDFLRRRLTVADNAVQLGVDHAVGHTKNRKVRPVPVPQFVLDELSVQCKGRARGSLVFGDGADYLPRPKSSGGWFAGAVKRAQVQKITPHDLRHTCASLAVSANVNVLALARMLGHADASVTLRVYADLFDSDLDRAAAAIHAAYGPGECGQNVGKSADGHAETA
ncbi:tyrosine-type recombinase/integrase [Nocardia mangyaensis]|uniref:tyrosine-type recombinase/integrase n=1 Tax=Nocardia mangyaensis TaxID=2213200 RepID=UPI002677036A|nr:site-specific integrase [Nocardia mangyaensis]MDO3647670.1 site-specific integrase [Nocardia mangyaensis]